MSKDNDKGCLCQILKDHPPVSCEEKHLKNKNGICMQPQDSSFACKEGPPVKQQIPCCTPMCNLSTRPPKRENLNPVAEWNNPLCAPYPKEGEVASKNNGAYMIDIKDATLKSPIETPRTSDRDYTINRTTAYKRLGKNQTEYMDKYRCPAETLKMRSEYLNSLTRAPYKPKNQLTGLGQE